VSIFKKPNIGKSFPIQTPTESDEFSEPKLGLQWQWHANPKVNWGFPSTLGYYTLFCQTKPKNSTNLFDIGNLLLQKIPAENATITTKITFNARADEEQTGLLVMGLDYSYLKMKKLGNSYWLSQVTCLGADKKGIEKESQSIALQSNTCFLRVQIAAGGQCLFYYSEDNQKFLPIGTVFSAKEGKWIGAKIGFLALRNETTNDAGNVVIDWFRVTK